MSRCRGAWGRRGQPAEGAGRAARTGARGSMFPCSFRAGLPAGRPGDGAACKGVRGQCFSGPPGLLGLGSFADPGGAAVRRARGGWGVDNLHVITVLQILNKNT